MFARPRPTVYSKRDANKVEQPLTFTDRPNALRQTLLPKANQYKPLFVVNNDMCCILTLLEQYSISQFHIPI